MRDKATFISTPLERYQSIPPAPVAMAHTFNISTTAAFVALARVW
jgi:hypothetical protein